MIVIMKNKLCFVISDRLQVANLFPVNLLVQEEPGSSDCRLHVLKFTNHKLFIIKFIEGEQKINQPGFRPPDTDTP